MKNNFNPESISQSEIDSIIRKFTDNNEGVVIGKPYIADQSFGTKLNWKSVSAKWADLKSVESNYSFQAIKTKMIELWSKIVNTPEDSVLGDMSIAFPITDERGKTVNFYWTDMYMLLREAIKVRKSTEEYRAKVRTLEAARAYRDKNKSKDEIMAETLKTIEALEAELDEGSSTADNTTTAAATNTATA